VRRLADRLLWHDSAMSRILVMHPGAMGSSIAMAMTGAGHEVLWIADGRSAASAARAVEAGCVAMPALEEALGAVEGVVSVVPPEHAVSVAEQVGALGFTGWYLDANAISPATARAIHLLVCDGGGSMVDGGIVGPPAHSSGTTRLALSGLGAEEIAAVFKDTAVEPVVVGSDIGAASAFKVGFAAWTKGSSALLLAVRSYASAEGIDGALLTEWERRGMDVAARSDATAAGVGPKAWRFAAEMDEIAAALTDVGIGSGFFDSAADLYRRLDEFKDQVDPPPSIDDLVIRILDQSQ
jgi:3-hydroxyisobutyrate dehydrogenase-like beta-hydroxyacid dehydrogenase